jgi:hypothetical protein
MTSDSPNLLIWRLLWSEVRRFRAAIGLSYLCAFGFAVTTLVRPLFFPLTPLTIFTLVVHGLAVFYAASSLLRNARTNGVISQLLLTPIRSSAYGAAFRALFLAYFFSNLLVLVALFLGLLMMKIPADPFWEITKFCGYLVAVATALYWASIFGIRRVILICAVPALLFMAMMVYHLVVHADPGAHELKEAHIIAFVGVTIVWFFGSASYNAWLAHTGYREVLRKRATP